MRTVIREKLFWIAALGYFVDLFDLVLYGSVRVRSLHDLHVPEDQIFSVGTTLLNAQMLGMVVGGIAWGILGDRKGRRSALFGSILLYSVATLLNAFVQSVPAYETLRFLAGLGLGGELGAAVTMVSEVMPKNWRSVGTAGVAALGCVGAAVGSAVAQMLPWKMAYLLGGVLGLFLMFTRLQMKETQVYVGARTRVPSQHFASWKLIFGSRDRLLRLLFCVLAGVPIWYVAGILAYFSPEFGRAFHVQGEVLAGTTITVGYLGSMIGDLVCGYLSSALKSRKKAYFIFLCAGALISIGHFFYSEGTSPFEFYFTRFLIGVASGYYVVLLTWSSELFGTNVRATMTTWTTNFVRASVIPLTMALAAFKPTFGLLQSSCGIGVVCFVVAALAAANLKDTFHTEIEFIETAI